MRSGLFILLLLLVLILFIFSLRIIIYNEIAHTMSKSRIKKLTKGQSFFERAFYTKFRAFIPKRFLVWYFSIPILFSLACATTLIFDFFGMSESYLICPMFVFGLSQSIPFIIHYINEWGWRGLFTNWNFKRRP